MPPAGRGTRSSFELASRDCTRRAESQRARIDPLRFVLRAIQCDFLPRDRYRDRPTSVKIERAPRSILARGPINLQQLRP